MEVCPGVVVATELGTVVVDVASGARLVVVVDVATEEWSATIFSQGQFEPIQPSLHDYQSIAIQEVLQVQN